MSSTRGLTSGSALADQTSTGTTEGTSRGASLDWGSSVAGDGLQGAEWPQDKGGSSSTAGALIPEFSSFSAATSNVFIGENLVGSQSLASPHLGVDAGGQDGPALSANDDASMKKTALSDALTAGGLVGSHAKSTETVDPVYTENAQGTARDANMDWGSPLAGDDPWAAEFLKDMGGSASSLGDLRADASTQLDGAQGAFATTQQGIASAEQALAGADTNSGSFGLTDAGGTGTATGGFSSAAVTESASTAVMEAGGSTQTAFGNADIGENLAGPQSLISTQLGVTTEQGDSLRFSSDDAGLKKGALDAETTTSPVDRNGASAEGLDVARKAEVVSAIEQHLDTHGLADTRASSKEIATELATLALDKIENMKEKGADLAGESLDLSAGNIQPTAARGPHGVSLEILDKVAQSGLSPDGLHELAVNLGAEAANQSNLQLADKAGPNAVADMAESGFPAEKVAAVQDLANSLGEAVGAKDFALSKLESLEFLKELSAPENAELVAYAQAEPGKSVTMGFIDKEGFAQNSELAGAEVSAINEALKNLERTVTKQEAEQESEKVSSAETSMSMA